MVRKETVQKIVCGTLAGVLALGLLFGAVAPAFAAASTPELPIIGASSTPEAVIENAAVQADRFTILKTSGLPQEAAVGTKSTLLIEFANQNLEKIYNVSAEISGNLVTPGQSQFLESLQASESGKVEFVVEGKDIGTVSGNVTFTYEDDKGAQYTKTQAYSLKIVAKPADPAPTPTPPPGGAVTVLAYSVQDSLGNGFQTLQPNQKCQIIVKIRDPRFIDPPEGDLSGKFLTINLTSTKSFSTPSAGDIYYTNLNATDALEYIVIFNDIMYLGGDNKLAFDLIYPRSEHPLQNVSVGISQCRDPKEDPSTTTGAKPRLMVQSSGFGGGAVSAGSTFELSVTTMNTSKTQALSDVATSISLPASMSLADGSNTVLTTTVAAGGTYTTTFAVQALPSAEAGVANITVEYSFYIKGTSDILTSNQTITVPIVQPDRFTFMALDAPTEIYVGEEASLTLNYVNKGKSALANLTAEISGNIENPGQSQYMGNLNSGTEGSVDFAIVATAAGTVSGTITIVYEDSNAKEITQTKEYSLTVLEAPVMEDPGMFPPGMEDPNMKPEPTGMPWWVWALIGVGGLAAVIAVLVVAKKAKVKKRERELAEEDEDDANF